MREGATFLEKALRLRQYASDRDKTLYSNSKTYSPSTDGVRFSFFDFDGIYERLKIVA